MGFFSRLFGGGRGPFRRNISDRYIVRDRIRLDYNLVREIFKEDTRDESGEGSVETLALYSDEFGHKYYLYYTDIVYSAQYVAGSYANHRYYFALRPEELEYDDEELAELCEGYMYSKN